MDVAAGLDDEWADGVSRTGSGPKASVSSCSGASMDDVAAVNLVGKVMKLQKHEGRSTLVNARVLVVAYEKGARTVEITPEYTGEVLTVPVKPPGRREALMEVV